MGVLNFSALEKYANYRYLIILPMLLLVVYYGLIASDRYTSQATFTVMENNSTADGFDIGLFGIGRGGGLDDERIIREYILSLDMLGFLDREVALKAHYQSDSADFLSRLSSRATQEEYLEYYLERISVDFDETSGLLIVEVQAFDAEFAVRMLSAVLKQTEAVVNDISQQLAQAQSDFLVSQLSTSEVSLKSAKQALLVFQNNNQVFSPEQEGESLTGIMAQLETSLIEEKTKLSQLLGFQKSDAPQVLATKERIRAINEQIVSEKARLVGDREGAVNDLLAEYTNLQLDLEFAKNAYATTLAALEGAKAEASKKLKHLIVVSRPSLAEEAKYPDKTNILITALMILTMLFGILRMAISTVREHRD